MEEGPWRGAAVVGRAEAELPLEGEGHRRRRLGGQAGDGHPRRVRQVRHQLPHLLQRVTLHQDVVLGQQERRNLAELPDRRRVGVGDHVPQVVKGVVQVMHPSPLSRVYGKPLVLQQKT